MPYENGGFTKILPIGVLFNNDTDAPSEIPTDSKTLPNATIGTVNSFLYEDMINSAVIPNKNETIYELISTGADVKDTLVPKIVPTETGKTNNRTYVTVSVIKNDMKDPLLEIGSNFAT